MAPHVRAERVAALEAMLAQDADDRFALYALAIERRTDERDAEAERLLRHLLQVAPDELYGYYQLGDLLLALGRAEEARCTLRAGHGRAVALGAAKAAAELAALLDLT